MSEVIYITQEKKEELERELIERKSEKRPDILKRLEAARALGDLKENAEYHTTRDEQGRNESRIGEIEHILKHYEIIEKSDDGVVALASTVVVKKDGSDDEQTFTIVGPHEADITAGRIADNSPLGLALLGRAAGEIAEFQTPKGKTTYQIISVE